MKTTILLLVDNNKQNRCLLRALWEGRGCTVDERLKAIPFVAES